MEAQPVIATAADLLDELISAGEVTPAQAVAAMYRHDQIDDVYVTGELEIRADGQVRHLRDDGEEIDPQVDALGPSSTYRHQITAR